MIRIVGYKDYGKDFLGIMARACGGSYARHTVFRKKRGDFVIPWGWCTSETSLNQGRKTLISKGEARIKMHKAGVPIPKLLASSDDRNIDGGEHEWPIVIRNNYHKQGTGFYLCYTMGEIAKAIRKCNDGWYASSLVEKAREYRVHVVKDRVLFVQDKLYVERRHAIAGVHNTGCEKWLWMDWDMLKEADNMLAIMCASLDAVKAVGFDFGAVDVMVDEDGKPFVLEVNTAPSLSSGQAKKYGLAFKKIAKKLKLPAKKRTITGLLMQDCFV